MLLRLANTYFGLSHRGQTLATAEAYAPEMAKEVVLTDGEFVSLVAVDGSPARSQMPPEIKARLTELRLVERRAWPNGPLWRTAAGDLLVRRGK